MKSIFKNSIIVAALLFGAASVSNAQVKVGANPAAIGTNSNLEVEAANGNKTIVDKATGQVTIQDGTQGVNKVLTSDAAGASSWKPVTAVLMPEVLLSVQRTTGQTVPFNVRTTIQFTNELFDDGNNFTLPSTFTAPSDGKYLLTLTVAEGASPAYHGRHLSYTVVGSQNYTKDLDLTSIDESVNYTTNVTTIIALKAGDQLTVNAFSNSGFSIFSADLQIMKVGN
jgi:hypothetical protein